jgi:hypothetical protein
MYKTPTFAEPQQCNRPFSTGQLSAFIIQLVTSALRGKYKLGTSMVKIKTGSCVKQN